MCAGAIGPFKPPVKKKGAAAEDEEGVSAKALEMLAGAF